jgi:hypothetical protein
MIVIGDFKHAEDQAANSYGDKIPSINTVHAFRTYNAAVSSKWIVQSRIGIALVGHNEAGFSPVPCESNCSNQFIETLASGEDRGGIALGSSSGVTISDVELGPIPGQEFI